ncbi:hypothetical protein FRB95_004823 [Tulasnella sp. JGI-2019a]|nr:hypothetical protein FRB95_004823 [Tulasnella sp. JGI-2019a]
MAWQYTCFQPLTASDYQKVASLMNNAQTIEPETQGYAFTNDDTLQIEDALCSAATDQDWTDYFTNNVVNFLGFKGVPPAPSDEVSTIQNVNCDDVQAQIQALSGGSAGSGSGEGQSGSGDAEA